MDPILPSHSDMERRRLEQSLDHDLHSMSMDSLPTHPTATSSNASTSFSTTLSLEYPRAAPAMRLSTMYPPNGLSGPHGTPRAAYRAVSGGSAASIGESPISTAGHHVSQMTLAEGVFRRAGAGREDDSGSEFDPERSLGRLVNELGKVMGGGRVSPRPVSPYKGLLSPPRSPSPLPSMLGGQQKDFNLSFTLNRNDPLLSPPQSRKSSSGSHSQEEETPRAPKSSTNFSSLAREIAAELAARKQTSAPRRALGETTRANVQPVGSATPGPNKVRTKDRVKALQSEIRRPVSAPARTHPLDVTGMTGLLETPAKGGEFVSIHKNEQLAHNGNIPDALATLHARLRALETENSVCRRRVRELEGELDRAKTEVESVKRNGGARLKEVIGEKSALEDLINSLRSHLNRITADLEENKALVVELRSGAMRSALPSSPPKHSASVSRELAELKREVERLGNEVHRLGGIIKQGLDTRRKSREQPLTSQGPDIDLLGPEPKEAEDVRLPSALRQGLHTTGNISPTLAPPTVEPPTRTSYRHSAPSRPISSRNTLHEPVQPSKIPLPPSSESDADISEPHHTKQKSSTRRKSTRARVEGPESPFPSIRAEDEQDFFDQMVDVEYKRGSKSAPTRSKSTSMPKAKSCSSKGPLESLGLGTTDEIPPQTVLARVLRELEDDFTHYKAIYAELADQYKVLDPASAAAKRHVLADHLREVIDILEQKADQIAALYDLLTFEDMPLDRQSKGKSGAKSVYDVLHMVKESLGDDGVRRLMEDGVGAGRKSHRVV